MGRLRRVLLTALPKVALSRATGALARVPIPRALRRALYGAYARRYGCDLFEMRGALTDHGTFGAFFRRRLADRARPIDPHAPFVWPADGRIVSSGPLLGDRLPQIKGVDYALGELVQDTDLAHRLARGSQATVYLSPADYHRVHTPFDGDVLRVQRVPGGLFPVNPGALCSIPGLFARNERVVLELRLRDGRAAAVVLVAALNVSDTEVLCAVPGSVAKGAEIAAFGLGSTVVAIVAPGEPSFRALAPQTPVRVGAPAV